MDGAGSPASATAWKANVELFDVESVIGLNATSLAPRVISSRRAFLSLHVSETKLS